MRKRLGEEHELVASLDAREQLGISKYGASLQTFNNRKAAQDLYEELIDAVQYCKQYLLEREVLEEIVHLLLNAHRNVRSGSDFLVGVDRAISLALELERDLPEYVSRDSLEKQLTAAIDNAEEWYERFRTARDEAARYKNILQMHAPLALQERYESS